MGPQRASDAGLTTPRHGECTAPEPIHGRSALALPSSRPSLCWLPRHAPCCCCRSSSEAPRRRSDTLPRPPIRCGPRPFSRPRAVVRCRFVCCLPAHFYTLLRPPALSPPCCTQRQWCARTTKTAPQDASALDAIGRCCECMGMRLMMPTSVRDRACTAVGHTGPCRTAQSNNTPS